MEVGYVRNPDQEDEDIVIPDPDVADGEQKQCFESLLTAILGDDFIIERLSSMINVPLGEVWVTVKQYEYDHGLASMKKQCLEQYGSTPPMIVIVRYRKRQWNEWVHYIIWDGFTVWEPQREVGYPNEDSWCQTCAIARFIELHHIPTNNLNIPWLVPGWSSRNIVYKHVACRNLAVRLIRMAFEEDYCEDHFDGVVLHQLDYIQEDDVQHYSPETFTSEIYDPQYN